MITSDIDRLKSKIRRQAARMIELQSTPACHKCSESVTAIDLLTVQLTLARQALRQEVIVNESTAAYLDQCMTEGRKVGADWRLAIVCRPANHSAVVTNALTILAVEEKAAMETTLKYTISDMSSKAREGMEMVVQMKADADTKLLHTTQNNIDLETDVEKTYHR
jgi:hypothetical protein